MTVSSSTLEKWDELFWFVLFVRAFSGHGETPDALSRYWGECSSRPVRSVARGWWKIFEVDSNTGIPFREQRGYFKGGGCTLQSSRDEALALRALIDASGLQIDFGTAHNPRDRSIADSRTFWVVGSLPGAASGVLSEPRRISGAKRHWPVDVRRRARL